MAHQWHTLSATATAQALEVDPAQGLDAAAATARLAQHGPNELRETGRKSPWRILWEQFTAVMVLILIGAAVLSLFLGKYLEAGAILAIVVLFGLLGFFQEYRAERAIAALKQLAVPVVRVRRAGQVQEISAHQLVPGDVVLLEAGSLVPADLRWLEAPNLRIQESALTGESEAVEKSATALAPADAPLGDRHNLGYMGTLVTYGRGVGLVVQTGMHTELGKIATLIQNAQADATPLQKKLDEVGKRLAVGGVAIALLITGMGLLGGEPLADMLLTAISIAVAVIPEGLPAVVTFTLAIGAQRMLKRQALIRKLPAVETLGSVTVICSDKTGTLTENRMTMTVIDAAGQRLELNPHGPTPHTQDPEIALALLVGALCNDAVLQPLPNSSDTRTVGDPTEGALLVAAQRNQLDQAAALKALPRVGELPFDADRKRMTTVHQVAEPTYALLQPLLRVAPTPYLACTKGSVDGLLEVSRYVWAGGQQQPLNAEWRQRIEAANADLARNGMRVLGIALRPLPQASEAPEVEQDLTIVGLVGIIDPPRAEVKDAVARCRTAGIRPVMITGDHPLTAAAIARELGLPSDRVLTGVELNTLTPDQLRETVQTVSIYARVSPEHKLRIVQALQAQGHIVAMTGDGVNDAPALKQANIGVAMGITGTDVSKEAAAMVLRDDNFATIVAAVEEGRVIYDNLRRFVKFAVAGNIGKVGVMLLWPLPFFLLGRAMTEAVALLPLQLLWLNLMTDGLLGLSLGMEPAEKNVMRRPPHAPTAGIFSGGLGLQTVWIGVWIGLLAMGIGFVYYEQNPNGPWQTMLFTTLAFLQVFQAFATRSNFESLFRLNPLGNPVMLGIAALVVLLQIGAIYLPGLSTAFLGTQPLALSDFLISVGVSALLVVISEIEKWWLRRRAKAA